MAAQLVVGRLGLNREAAQAVVTLFKPYPSSGTLTATSACLLVLGAMAVARALQSWYQSVFDVPGRGRRDIPVRLYWLAALFAYAAAQAALGKALGAHGGPVLESLVGFALATFFWWWSMKLLLAGAASWRSLFPAALATGVCWAGLGVFSARYFSTSIVSNERSYGPIGVMVILS